MTLQILTGVGACRDQSGAVAVCNQVARKLNSVCPRKEWGRLDLSEYKHRWG
jgi:hypothetical protein